MKNPYGFSFPGTTGEFRVHSREMKSEKYPGAGGSKNLCALYMGATAVGFHAQKLVFKRGITPVVRGGENRDHIGRTGQDEGYRYPNG